MKYTTKSQKNSPPLFVLDDGEEVCFEDLLKKIYVNSEEKSNSITAVAQKLLEKTKTLNDMVVVMPILVDMQKVSVQNDDMLVKMAAIVQRSQTAKAKNTDIDESIITPEDRKMLMDAVKNSKIPGSSSGGD